METNFFNKIAQMDINSKLMLTIAKATPSTLVVSIFIENDGCGDKAKNMIIPFNITATADELDEHFFQHIKKPLQKADGLLTNMENFLKQLETTEANSAMAKQKSEHEKKTKDAKKRTYDQAWLKAEMLEKEGKFKEAWTALPKATEYPEHAKTIRDKQQVYEREFAQNLFSDSPEKTGTEEIAENEPVNREEE
ncbi:MAG: PRTRC system protein E [Sphingobacterium sp.]|jgi:PRTRC genetic system protein E|nr:PRTRC system protein E [Sphingobacterium sp.]